MKAKPIPFTQEYLKSILDYNPETGIFRWKIKPAKNISEGATVGYLANSGYLTVTIKRKPYFLHRLAWLYEYGEDPVINLDHIDRIKTNNRKHNLRKATDEQNAQNKGVCHRTKSKFKGVYWRAKKHKWEVQICSHGKKYYLGYFSDLELAVFVQEEASRKYHKEFSHA